MLIHPLLLQGVVALKAILLFTLAPTWHTTFNDGRFRHPTIGQRVASTALGFTLAGGYMFIYGNPIHLLDPAPPACTDLVVWQSFSDLLAPRKPPGWIDPSELDWTIPGQPTLRAHKVEKVVPPDVISFDIYITQIDIARKSSALRDDEEKHFVPVVPDDAPPPGWRYEQTEQMFHRLCLKKGRLPAHIGPYRDFAIGVCRLATLVFFAFELVLVLLPIPRAVKKAWRKTKSFIRRERRRERRRRRLRNG